MTIKIVSQSHKHTTVSWRFKNNYFPNILCLLGSWLKIHHICLDIIFAKNNFNRCLMKSHHSPILFLGQSNCSRCPKNHGKTCALFLISTAITTVGRRMASVGILYSSENNSHLGNVHKSDRNDNKIRKIRHVNMGAAILEKATSASAQGL